jgi:hypothetical protein
LAETACGRFRSQPSGFFGVRAKGVAFARKYASSAPFPQPAQGFFGLRAKGVAFARGA